MAKENKPQKSTLRRITPQLDNVMDIFRYIESSDESGSRALNSDKKQKETGEIYASTGYGYYQVLKRTLDDINKSVVADGLKPLTLNTREEQHEAMRRLIVSYDEHLRNNMGIKNPTIADYYGVHFNGPSGYKKIKQGSNKDSIKNYVTSDAAQANPTMYGGTVDDYYKQVNKKISEAQSQLKKESPSRKQSLYKEKTGFDNGTSTPVDLRPGEYRGDGKEKWAPNASAFNGTKLGEQNFDYVLSKTDGKAKVLKANSTNVADIEGDYKPLEYDYSKNIYDPALDRALPNTPGAQNYEITGNDFGGNQGFGADLYKIPDVEQGRSKEIQYAKASRADIANTAAPLYDNPNNPASAVGNQDHLKVDVNGKMIGVDQLPLQIDSAVTQQQDLLAANPTIPRNNAQQQFKLGGDMAAKNQNNQSLVTFDAGGSHEENPLGGIPQNVNPDGTQNTVEEGETKHKDYVFSNSITILPAEAEDLMLPEEIEGMTYADASKYLNKALEENETDPIIKRTVERQLDNLKAGNEKARLKIEDQQLAEQEYEANLQSQSQINSADSEGDIPSEVVNPDNSLPTGDMNSSAMQLDPTMVNQPGNDQLVNNPDVPQQFRLGGKMLVNGGYDNGLNEWNSAYLTGQGEPQGYNQTRDTYNVPTIDGDTSNIVSSVGGSYGAAAGGVAQGGLQMKEAFSLKDRVERGEKIDKGQVALKGAASGATVGAAAGSVVPVIGTAIGGAIGAVAGGVGGLIVGNNAQKKSEKRKFQLDKMALNNSISDFRTGSGYIEGDTREFATGGDLRDPYSRGTGITYNDFDEEGFMNNLDRMNFELNGTTLDELVIETQRPKNVVVPNTQPDYTIDSPSTSATKSKTKEQEQKKFQLKGGNPLQYAGLYGAYDQMRRLENKPDWRESYISSGTRYDPQLVDENLMLNQINSAGATTDRIIQENASGSAGAARAGLIASAGKTQGAVADAYLKSLEFNNAQRQFALQNDNQLLANRDAIINRQTENNMANEQAEYRLEQSARNNWFNTLGAYGKDQTENNTIENMTQYDRYGRRIGNTNVDQLAKRVSDYIKNKNKQ